MAGTAATPPDNKNQVDSPPKYDPNWSTEAHRDNVLNMSSSSQNPVNKGNPEQNYGYSFNIQQQPLYYQAPSYQQRGYYPPGTVYMAPQQQVIVGPPPENHAALAWLTCLCCCWPLGLVAIVKSMEVNSAWSRGDFDRAESSSASARRFSYLALGFGIAGYVIFMIFIFMFISGFSHMHHY